MHLLVGNPTAQSGRNAERIDAARTLLSRHGLTHDFLATSPAGGTVRDVAERLRSGQYDTVVAMGGDGTFNEVARGLLESGTGVVMGMLPTGTANDQGRSFGLSAAPGALARNVEVLAARHVSPLDAGKVTSYGALDDVVGHGWFFDSIGWGLSAKVLRVRNEDRDLVSHIPIVRDLYRDQLVYAGAVLQMFLAGYVDEQHFEAEVAVDGAPAFYVDLSDLIVKNTRYYAGMWIFDPTASPEDGAMELVPLKGRQELVARALLHHELRPILDLPIDPLFKLSPITRGTRFLVKIHDRPMSAPVEAQVDGEEFPAASAYLVEVVKHALPLVTPAPGTT